MGPWDDFVEMMEGGAKERLLDRDESPIAHTLIDYAKPMRIWFWFPKEVRPKTPRWSAVIAHEALHGVMAVFTSRGIPVNDDHDEPATYYLGWLVEIIHQKLLEKKS